MPDAAIHPIKSRDEIQAALGDDLFSTSIACLDFHCGLYGPSFEVFGRSIDAEELAAAMGREFGEPNLAALQGSELGRYLLTTGRPDMLLAVTLDEAGGSPFWHFRFWIPHHVWQEARFWPHRHADAHKERFHLWVAGLPAGQARDELSIHRLPETLQAMYASTLKAREMGGDSSSTWMAAQREKFEQIDPKPESEGRDFDWKKWPDDDPAKPYVSAAAEALTQMSGRLGPITTPEMLQ